MITFWIELILKKLNLLMLELVKSPLLQRMYPDIQLMKVISVAKASGSEFALLPPQNASEIGLKLFKEFLLKFQLTK